jgi:GNAT superfamily N-acetyltransferase
MAKVRNGNMPNMKIEQILATDKIEECWGLLSLHREELATYKNIMILKPDIAKYKSLENSDKLLTLALYDDDRIVGYSVLIFSDNLHYLDLHYAHNDILYVHPDYRNSKWGLKLIAESEHIAKSRGAKMILWHGKEKTQFAELMPKLGYKVQDIVFSKEL